MSLLLNNVVEDAIPRRGTDHSTLNENGPSRFRTAKNPGIRYLPSNAIPRNRMKLQ